MTVKALPICGAVLLLALAGCTSTRIVGEGAPDGLKGQFTYAQVQNRLRGKSVCVTLKDNRSILASVHTIARDSVHLLDEASNSSLVVPTREVSTIQCVDRVDGGIMGFLGGALSGLLLGGAIGDMTLPRGDGMRGLGVAVAALGGAGLGAIGGTIYGAIHGMVDRFEFEPESLKTGTP